MRIVECPHRRLVENEGFGFRIWKGLGLKGLWSTYIELKQLLWNEDPYHGFLK